MQGFTRLPLQQQILELLQDGGGNRSLAWDERLREHGNKKPLTEFQVFALLKNAHEVERWNETILIEDQLSQVNLEDT